MNFPPYLGTLIGYSLQLIVDYLISDEQVSKGNLTSKTTSNPDKQNIPWIPLTNCICGSNCSLYTSLSQQRHQLREARRRA